MKNTNIENKNFDELEYLSRKNEFKIKSIIVIALFGGAFLLCEPLAIAGQVYQGNFQGKPLDVRLDMTFQYSNAIRISSPSAQLAGPGNPNGNDGDSNLRHGLVDNTLEVLPVLDVDYGNYGLYLSGQAFLDTPYLGHTQNNQASTYNAYTVSNNDFTRATRNVAGKDAELLDANVRGTWYLGSGDTQPVTLKVGRQTLMWGESVFFSSNGIAGGMSPVDIWKAQTLPNAETQQVLLPVGQAVATYQPNSVLTVQAYYQFEWRHNAFPASGTYFSSGDILDEGGQRVNMGPNRWLYRTDDRTPGNNNGQFGLSTTITYPSYNIGFYALRWDAKNPNVGASFVADSDQPGSVGKYWLVYPKDIQTYGASYSTDIGPVSFGSELSARRNMPLVSNFIFDGQNPMGTTLAGQASGIYLSPPLPLDPGGVSATGEVAFNHVLSVNSGKENLTMGRNATASAFEFSLSPTYDSVLPNLDLTIPVGLTYDFLGNSEVDSTMNHGYGSYNLGVSATYYHVWNGSITYVGYFGRPNGNLQGTAAIVDRGYISFNLSRSI